MRVGDPDGHGRFGELTEQNGRLVCHECGRTYLHLASHAFGAHGLSSEQYRIAHGLPLTAALVASGTARRMSQSWERNRQAHMEALESSRNPDVARARVRPRSQWTPATRVARARMLSARRGRLLTEDEMRDLGDEIPLDEWCRRVRVLLAVDPSLSALSISRSFDRSPAWCDQRLRRYP